MKQPGLYVVYAAAVRDAAGVNASPGAVLVVNGRVAYSGDPAGIESGVIEQAEVLRLGDKLLLPSLINAHTHLQLTDIGPRPYDPAGGFIGWVQDLRSLKREQSSASQVITHAARQCMASGIGMVGDITDAPDGVVARQKAGLGGVSYVELFGLGKPFDQLPLSNIQKLPGGLQPHAPYSAGPKLFEAAAKSGRHLCTHLAETLAEAQLIAEANGPWLAYLQSIGRWDASFAGYYGSGLSPVQWMKPYLEAAAEDGGWLVAHCNYVDDADIELLANTNTSVAYCPIASEYFGHQGHRYRDMLAAGVNVCLGTDSIVCANPNDPQPLSVLGAMRRLYQRDNINPATLLMMATINGAKALRLLPRKALLQEKSPAKFACIGIDPDHPDDALQQALTTDAPAEMLDLATLDQSWFRELDSD